MKPSAQVTWAADGVEPFVDEGEVRAATEAAVAHGGRPGLPVDVIFVREAELTRMHAEYLDDPTPTDVITFDLGASGEFEPSEGPAGELYVSVDRAIEVVKERGGSPRAELLLYVVHGCLHLCGFDDHEDADRERMRAAERAVCDRLHLELTRGPHEFE